MAQLGLEAGHDVSQAISSAPYRYQARILIHAPAATVRGSVGQWTTIEEIDAERCLLRMTVDNLNWTALTLGTVGAEFEVVKPPELLAHIREWADLFTRATGA